MLILKMAKFSKGEKTLRAFDIAGKVQRTHWPFVGVQHLPMGSILKTVEEDCDFITWSLPNSSLPQTSLQKFLIIYLITKL